MRATRVAALTFISSGYGYTGGRSLESGFEGAEELVAVEGGGGVSMGGEGGGGLAGGLAGEGGMEGVPFLGLCVWSLGGEEVL